LCEGLKTQARYDTPDKDGETRRERNARFGQSSPEPFRPVKGRYLWEWFISASDFREFGEHGPKCITPGQWKFWAEINSVEVRPEEFKVLVRMDRSYINALNVELSEQRNRLIKKG
jgi:hypothetical protein